MNLLKSAAKVLMKGKYLHHHRQNLSECPNCGHAHGVAWAGRAWWMIYDRTDKNGEPEGNSRDWNFEWHLFQKRIKQLTFALSVGGGDTGTEIQFHWAVPFLCNLFFSCEGYIPSQYDRGGEREIEIRYDFDINPGGSLWWNLWTPVDSWDNKTPRWRHGAFYPLDFLLGAPVFSSQPVSHQYGYIVVTEGKYPMSIQRTRDTWKRPRWPWPDVVTRWTIKPEVPVPIPGKGENSWDCDEDAVYEMTVAAETAEEALHRFLESIEKQRKRHGGDGWVPKAKGGKVN